MVLVLVCHRNPLRFTIGGVSAVPGGGRKLAAFKEDEEEGGAEEGVIGRRNRDDLYPPRRRGLSTCYILNLFERSNELFTFFLFKLAKRWVSFHHLTVKLT